MNFYKINSNDTKELFKKIGTDDSGAKIMAQKTDIHLIYIKDLKVGGANILKQDALSIGADLAVPMGTIIARDEKVDAVLMGTTKHLEILSRKELAQPFGLKTLAKGLKEFINTKKYPTRIMGIINANDDSFFSGSRFPPKGTSSQAQGAGEDAVSKIKQMIKDGASIIDIGGVSTRPGSDTVSEQEEMDRVKPICDLIEKEKLYKEVDFSIDSFTPSVIEYALKSGFKIVNDVTGLSNDEVARVASKYKAAVVIMHMQGKPKDMQHNPSYEDVIIEVDRFFSERIAKAKKFGIEEIILDIGIGFGKTLEHNLTLLKHTEHFKHFGYELLIGASRKSMINKITPCPTQERLPGTLAIHLDSIKRGSSIVRCHDVKEHVQAVKVQEAIENIL
ncbi:MAG: dihydropteroate synthase [Campylobacterota bacterium]|nr:dihydropteroate synthase [Campylobacterota bacterium]